MFSSMLSSLLQMGLYYGSSEGNDQSSRCKRAMVEATCHSWQWTGVRLLASYREGWLWWLAKTPSLQRSISQLGPAVNPSDFTWLTVRMVRCTVLYGHLLLHKLFFDHDLFKISVFAHLVRVPFISIFVGERTWQGKPQWQMALHETCYGHTLSKCLLQHPSRF